MIFKRIIKIKNKALEELKNEKEVYIDFPITTDYSGALLG